MPLTEFGGCTPILPVRNLTTSVDYYVNTLGFRLDWHDPGIAASVSRGRCGLFLIEGDQGHPGTWVWIGVPDADALHAEYLAKGAIIRQPPTNFSWGCDLQISDPDGNVLRMGSDRIPGKPEGPWLNMRGERWLKAADGWRKQI
jgi:catechol 2,3-dioxygenase-like lactoylglutathione lyase family enzyme